MRSIGKIGIVGICLMVLVGLSGGLDADILASEKAPIKIGMTFPLTGPIGLPNQQCLKLMQAYWEDVNKEGGIDGHMIEWVVSDNQAKANKAVSDAMRFIQRDKVHHIQSGGVSTPNIALAKWAEENEQVVISYNTHSDSLDGLKWYFHHTSGNTPMLGAWMKRAKKQGFKTAALIHSSLAWGMDGRRIFERDASKYGLKIVAIEAVEIGTTDLTVQTSRLKKANPDVVFNMDYVSELGVFLKARHNLKWNVPVITSGTVLLYTLPLVPKEMSDGVEAVTYSDPSNPEVQMVLDYYEKISGEKLGNIGVLVTGYDTARAVVIALKNCAPDFSPAAFREAFSKVKFDMAAGFPGSMFCFGPSHPNYVMEEDDWVPVVTRDRKYHSIK